MLKNCPVFKKMFNMFKHGFLFYVKVRSMGIFHYALAMQSIIKLQMIYYLLITIYHFTLYLVIYINYNLNFHSCNFFLITFII